MALKLVALGEIGIKLFHTLTPKADSAHLLRRLELTLRDPVKLFMPLVAWVFRAENERMTKALKAFAEGPS